MIQNGQDIIDTDIIITATAGEALSARDAVYIKTSDGKAYKCDASDVTKIGFVGFAQAATLITNTVYIKTSLNLGGFSGLTINAPYYLDASTPGAITATKPTNYKIVGVAKSASVIQIANFLTKRTTLFTSTVQVGDRTTQFDITNPSGTTFRYTYDGTGTDPSISAVNYPIGTPVDLQAANFAAGNKGRFLVTGSGANYIEVTNASGVVESNKTISTGYITKGQIYTKITSAVWIEVEGVGGGGGGEGSGTSANPPPTTGARTVFDSATPLIGNGGGGVTSSGGGPSAGGGTASGGDFNSTGAKANQAPAGLVTGTSGAASLFGASYGCGGDGALSLSGGGGNVGGTGGSAGGYFIKMFAGPDLTATTSVYVGTGGLAGSGTSQNGNAGQPGAIKVIEYY